MNQCKRLLPALLFVFVFFSHIQAQNKNLAYTRYKPPFGVISVTGGIGAAYYRGDLNSKVSVKNLNLGPSLSLGGLFRITEHFSARGELRFYQVSAPPSPGTNLSFRTRNPDLNIGIQADLFPFNKNARVNPYIYGGLGITYLNPKAKFQENWISLRPLTTEMVAYSRTPVVLSGGVGVSIKTFKKLSIGAELNGNYLFSDYLDDVGKVYPNFDQLPSDLARQLSDRTSEAGLPAQQPGWHRGSLKINDIYLFLQVRATYMLVSRKEAFERKKMRCPKF